MVMPQHRNPYPWVHEIANFDGPFFCHHQYILSLSDLCLGVEKKILKEIVPFHFPAQERLPQGQKNLHFVRPSLCHHYNTLCLSESFLIVNEKILKEIMHFHYMTYMGTPQHENSCPGGHKIYKFNRLLLCHQYCTIFLSEPCLRSLHANFLRPESYSSAAARVQKKIF